MKKKIYIKIYLQIFTWDNAENALLGVSGMKCGQSVSCFMSTNAWFHSSLWRTGRLFNLDKQKTALPFWACNWTTLDELTSVNLVLLLGWHRRNAKHCGWCRRESVIRGGRALCRMMWPTERGLFEERPIRRANRRLSAVVLQKWGD